MHAMTEQFMHNAFAGESMAHMRYMVYAEAPEKDGFKNVARLFRAVAFAEQVHATGHMRRAPFKMGSVAAEAPFGVGKTSENLANAVAGETYEIEEMYSVFMETAKFQGEKLALTSFAWAFTAEKVHQKMYLEAKGLVDYRIRVVIEGRQAPAVLVAGNDSRGVLFGIGRLLQELRIYREESRQTRGQVRLPAEFRITTAPSYPLRGHQFGYRPKVNSYDGWTPDIWEQYIRDLAVFGTNAYEMMPPRTDDAADSPHFPLPQIEMMAIISGILDRYDLDVWIWYPALDKDYSDPATVEFALKEWEAVFKKLPRIDVVFVPGGDPGHTPPKVLFPFLERQAALLKRHHPKAQLWLSPQGFNFILFRVMPGDPTISVIPKGVAPDSVTFELLRRHYALDQP